MMRVAVRGLFAAMALAATTAATSEAAGQSLEEKSLLQFQRAADTYAFQHRQVERHLGGTLSQDAIAAGLRTERAVSGEGVLFTPLAGSAFRNRIQLALGKGRCVGPETSVMNSIVPRASDSAAGTVSLPACLASALPKLPPELEYRAAGVALVLIDVHAGLVVDVLHGAFPMKND